MNPTNVFSVKLYNDAIVAISIAKSVQLGLLDEIADNGRVDLLEFCANRNLAHSSISRLVKILCYAKVLDQDASANFTAGELFPDVYGNAGYHQWLFLGYGGLLARDDFGTMQMGDPLKGRNGAQVAAASARIGTHHVDSTLKEILASRVFRSVIDLGCGNASRLIWLASRNPGLVGTGIEIDAGAVEAAQANIEAAGLGSQITMIRADVEKLDASICQRLPQELVMMNFLGHDMWPRLRAEEVFRNFRNCFSRCDRFILADTLNSSWDGSSPPGIFTLGFELVHEVMGKYIPTEAEWQELFHCTGWEIRRVVPLEVPLTQVFELIPSNT
jgi:SAM-dependent methyltransferase